LATDSPARIGDRRAATPTSAACVDPAPQHTAARASTCTATRPADPVIAAYARFCVVVLIRGRVAAVPSARSSGPACLVGAVPACPARLAGIAAAATTARDPGIAGNPDSAAVLTAPGSARGAARSRRPAIAPTGRRPEPASREQHVDRACGALPEQRGS